MPRKQAARDRLFQIQLKLNRQIQREAEALLGKPSLEISGYSRALERDFLPLRKQFADPTKRNSALLRKWSASQSELLHQLKHSEIILMGDYHPFGQSQRTALRILRSAHHESHPLQWLGLEMISSKYQKINYGVFRTGFDHRIGAISA